MNISLLIATLLCAPFLAYAQTTPATAERSELPTAKAVCQLTGHPAELKTRILDDSAEVGATYCQVLAGTELSVGTVLHCVERYQEEDAQSLCEIAPEGQTVYIEYMN